jgi:hypothetical protein
MLEDILRQGFARANQRAGLILLDNLWKAVWLLCSLAAFVFLIGWFGSELHDIAWEDTGVRRINLLVAFAVLRQFWNAVKGEIVLSLVLLIGLSLLAWFLLEAFVRSRMFAERGLKPATTYLISRLSKTTVLATAGMLLVVVALEGAPFLAAVIFLALAFCLTLIETLIRSDAVELLGTDLIRVTGLIGILVSFETIVAASLLVMLTVGFMNVARPGDALAMLGVTSVAAAFLSILHSYLLLVRFCAVGIMRQNVVAV